MNIFANSYLRMFFTFVALLVGCAVGCKKQDGKTNTTGDQKTAQMSNHDDTNTDETEQEPEDRTLLQKTGGMIKQATDSSLDAANKAGNWIKDTVQDSFESGKEATVNTGNAIRKMFQQAKEQGTTTANNVLDFVQEDIAKLGSWQYTSRTVANEKPDEIVTMLNRMGSQKWECFWVDKQATETILYFKKSPRSYVSSIPFKDLIRYLPELGGDSQ